MASYPCTATAHDLANKIAQRLPTFTVTEDVDAEGNPLVLVTDGDFSPGDESAVIRVSDAEAWGVDGIGQTQRVYGPHTIDVALEAANNAWTTNLPLLKELLDKGTKVSIWEETNGTEPDVTTFDTDNKLKMSVDSLNWPTMASI